MDTWKCEEHSRSCWTGAMAASAGEKMMRRFLMDLGEDVRLEKPRRGGMTEIRSPFHSFLGLRQLEEILDSAGSYVDGLKFMGGSASLMSTNELKDMINLAHQHGIYVSSGGWAEHKLNKGRPFFKQYVKECKDIGFDIIEFNTFSEHPPEEDLLHLIRLVKSEGLKAKPGLLIGNEGVDSVIRKAERFLEAGADVILVESEGITDEGSPWQTDVIAKLVGRLGLDKTMFEAADPNVFEWYIRNYGTGVNLFVDHSHVIQVECMRSGRWGIGRRLLLL